MNLVSDEHGGGLVETGLGGSVVNIAEIEAKSGAFILYFDLSSHIDATEDAILRHFTPFLVRLSPFPFLFCSILSRSTYLWY